MAGGSGEQSVFLEALTKTEAKKDGGFANNWSFKQTEDSEGDAERDEANLLSVDDSDGVSSSFEEPKSKQLRQEAARGDSLKTYEKRAKCLNLRNLKGNATGLNMLGPSKKIGDNTQNISASPGTVLHGRRFHHANSQMSAVKTAAQRKEYPPDIQKIDDDHIRLPRTHILENDVDSKEEPDVDSGCEIKRRVVQKRRCESYAGALSSSPALKTGFNRLDVGQKKYVSEQIECMSRCPDCTKENGSQTKCQKCANLQRHSRQSITFNELSGPLPRPAIHQNSAVNKPFPTGLNSKKFYGTNFTTVPVDILLNHELGRNLLPANGKVGLSDDLHKHARTIKLRGIRSSEMSDPIVLSSDDEEDDDSSTGSTRVESTSPRPADSACSSPAPSSGKVEAAFKENTSKVEQRLNKSIAADTECTVALPRKARMKDQFGNAVASIPVKRRKVAQQETVPKSICDSFILTTSCIKIGSLAKDVGDPVIFRLDEVYIKIPANVRDVLDIRLRTSELTKCDWCNASKFPVIYLQTVPAACLRLRSQLNMSREKDNKWYDCKSTKPEEQFIVFMVPNPLEKEESTIFEKFIGDIGIRNKIPDFLTRLNLEDVFRRQYPLYEDRENVMQQNMSQKDNKTKIVAPDSRKLRSSASPLKFFDDEDESGESHSVFIGPIVKLIVYPPPPAKGGISVTNEDLHCLNEGEFLNDVIIDFYLKYLVLEKLKKDADRIHVFSSFFYKRLNQRERRNLQETANLSLQQRRHGRVKTWTRNVDIFQKDFIFVPLNEAAHWFLAVICFPGLTDPVYKPNPHYQAPVDMLTCTTEEDNGVVSQVESSAAVEALLPNQTAKKTPCKKQISVSGEGSCGNKECDTPRTRKSPCRGKRALRNESEENCEAEGADTRQSPSKVDVMTKSEICNQNENKTPVKASDALDSLRLSYSDDPGDSSKTSDDQFIDFSEDQDNLDGSSDDGTMADEAFPSDPMRWDLKYLNCKQPCILLMDSLRGPSRSNVVRTLREYLEVEWEVRKGSKRSFSKEYMKGSNPRVPQQNNFSDCGVYILQYVESFFENPIQSFDLPMNLTDWFHEERMKTKREEIRNLILNLQELQNKDKKGQKDLESTTSPDTPQDKTDELIPHDSTH